MELHIDRKKRRQFACKAVYVTTARKVGLLLLLLSVVSIILLLFYYPPNIVATDDSDRVVIIFGIIFVLFFIALLCFCLVYNKSQASITLRRRETLSVENGVLFYRYNILSSRYAPYLWIYVINLNDTIITKGVPGQYFLRGAIRIYYLQKYAYIPGMVTISPEDMEEFDGVLEMWDYWQPGLYDTILAVQTSSTVNTNRNNQTYTYTTFGR